MLNNIIQTKFVKINYNTYATDFFSIVARQIGQCPDMSTAQSSHKHTCPHGNRII